jgi:hypothetical protein
LLKKREQKKNKESFFSNKMSLPDLSPFERELFARFARVRVDQVDIPCEQMLALAQSAVLDTIRQGDLVVTFTQPHCVDDMQYTLGNGVTVKVPVESFMACSSKHTQVLSGKVKLRWFSSSGFAFTHQSVSCISGGGGDLSDQVEIDMEIDWDHVKPLFTALTKFCDFATLCCSSELLQ